MKRCVQEGGEEAGDAAGRVHAELAGLPAHEIAGGIALGVSQAMLLFRNHDGPQPAVEKAQQQAVDHPGEEPLHKGQHRADRRQRRAHAGKAQDAEALQKADEAEGAADHRAAQRAHGDGRDGHGNHVEYDVKAAGHRDVHIAQHDLNGHQQGQQHKVTGRQLLHFSYLRSSSLRIPYELPPGVSCSVPRADTDAAIIAYLPAV